MERRCGWKGDTIGNDDIQAEKDGDESKVGIFKDSSPKDQEPKDLGYGRWKLMVED